MRHEVPEKYSHYFLNIVLIQACNIKGVRNTTILLGHALHNQRNNRINEFLASIDAGELFLILTRHALPNRAVRTARLCISGALPVMRETRIQNESRDNERQQR